MSGLLFCGINSGSGVDASGVAGFLDDYFYQPGQAGQQPLPDPPSEVFAGRVFKTVNVIQAVVVELVEQGLECLSQVGKIHHPARVLAYRATDVYFDAEGMAVQAGALVPFGNVGQPVRGFDLKNAKNIHKRIVTLMD